MTQFFISFCAGCILIGALYIICPDGNIGKPIKAIFSLIFLCIVISAANIPLGNIDFEAFSQTNTDTNLRDMQETAAEYVFSETLTKNGIKFSEIYFETDILKDGSISITKVVIVSGEDKAKILESLGELQNNREVEIINE